MKIISPPKYPWVGAMGTCKTCDTSIELDAEDIPDQRAGDDTFWKFCPTCHQVIVCRLRESKAEGVRVLRTPGLSRSINAEGDEIPY